MSHGTPNGPYGASQPDCSRTEHRSTAICHPSFHRPELHDALGPRFRDVDRPVFADGDIVHRVEHRAAWLSEADGGNDVPVAIQLQHAGVLRIVIGASDADVIVAIGIGGNAKDASG